MKLTRDAASNDNLVTSYDATHIAINRQRYEHSLAVTPDTVLAEWGAGGFAALTEADITALAALAPALVIVGTGTRQRFPAPALLRPLIDAHIGFEIMDTGSACRTYNILAAEGRKVAAALLLDTPDAT
ncbi:MAG: Mth938-like domain-containing protein [Rhodocyclaceae bacterium]